MNAGKDANTRVVEFMKKRKVSSPQRRVSRDGQKVYCRFNCGKKCTRSGIHSHELHHCPNNPNRKARNFGREACPVCGQIYDRHYLRQHLFTQHTAIAAQIYNGATREPSPGATETEAAVGKRDRSPAKRNKSKVVVREAPAKAVEMPSAVGMRISPQTKRETVLAQLKQRGLG